jgi:hypothetical protein
MGLLATEVEGPNRPDPYCMYTMMGRSLRLADFAEALVGCCVSSV